MRSITMDPSTARGEFIATPDAVQEARAWALEGMPHDEVDQLDPHDLADMVEQAWGSCEMFLPHGTEYPGQRDGNGDEIGPRKGYVADFHYESTRPKDLSDADIPALLRTMRPGHVAKLVRNRYW